MSKNTKSFLFVNKDSSSASLTRSSAQEQSSINSHVQRGRRHKRQPANARRKGSSKEAAQPTLKESDTNSSENSPSGSSPSASSTSSTSLPTRSSPRPTGPEDSTATGEDGELDPAQVSYADGERDARIRTAQQTADDLVDIAGSTPGDPSPSQDAELGHQTAHGLLTPNLSPTDITQYASNPLDPFHNSSVPLDAKTHSLIVYYQRVYHPAVWHVETKASPKGGYAFQTSANDVIRSALVSDVDMYALLACMAARLQYVDLREGYCSMDEYLGKALAATRRFIMQRSEQGPKSHEEILMVIFHLYAAEGYRTNMAAAKIHMKAAKTIVTAIGGLAKLRDPQMRELLIIGDGLLSAMTMEPCELPCEFDPGPYLCTINDETRIQLPYSLDGICPALRRRVRADILPSDMQDIIDEIAELNWVLTNAKHSPPTANQHAMRWIQMRSMAIRHRLLAFEAQSPQLVAFRVTLVLWVVTTTTLLGLVKLAPGMAPQVRARLKAVTAQGLDFKHTDIKAWMLSLGAVSAMPGSEDAKWFVRKLTDLMLSAGLIASTTSPEDQERILSELEKLQKDFFYHEAVHAPYLQTLAKNIAAEVTKRRQWRSARMRAV